MQYINEIQDNNFKIRYDVLLNTYNVYQISVSADTDKKPWDVINKQVVPTLEQSVPSYVLMVYVDRCHYLLAEPKEDNFLYSFMNQFSNVDCQPCHEMLMQRMPLYAIGNLLLLTTLPVKKGIMHAYYRYITNETEEMKKGIDSFFTRRIEFRPGEKDNTVLLTLKGKTFCEKSSFYDIEDESKLEWYTISTNRIIQKIFHVPTQHEKVYTVLKPDHKNKYNKKKNTIKNFDAEGLKTLHEAQEQEIFVISKIYDDLKNSQFVEDIQFSSIDVVPYEDAKKIYKCIYKRFEAQLSEKKIHFVIGEDVFLPDKITEYIQTNMKSLPYGIDSEIVTKPKGYTLYLIQNPQGGSASDAEYNKEWDDAIVQHAGVDTIFTKSGKLVEPAFMNCCDQLFIKEEVKTGKASLHRVNGEYAFYFPHEDPRLADIVRLIDDKIMFYTVEKSENSMAANLDIKELYHKKPSYIMVKKTVEGLPEFLCPAIYVYESDVFAVPNFDVLMPVLHKYIADKEFSIDKDELFRLMDMIEDTDDIINYKQQMMNDIAKKYPDTNKVYPGKLVIKGKLKTKLNQMMNEKYGVNFVLSVKGEKESELYYPAFFSIVYSKKETGGEFFVPSYRGLMDGLNKVPTHVRKWNYRIEGLDKENFIEELLEMICEPCSKYKQLSVYPFAKKYLYEYKQLQKRI